jgi:hypothetical protein
MKKSFFSDQGLTSRSADHICNLAKASYEDLEIKLKSTTFVEEYLSIIGHKEETIVSYATRDILTEAPEMIKQIYKLKSLVGWLREAMKEKTRLYEENKNFVSEETRLFTINRPQKEAYLTREELVEQWDVKQQEDYIACKTLCSVIGNYIHPDKPLDKAMKELSKRINKPITTEISGRDTIIRRFQVATTEEEVKELFFSLQKWHREVQARLNGMEHKLDVQVREDIRAKDEAYKAALNTYHATLEELLEKDSLERLKREEEIEKLKIVIPHDLYETYEYLNNLGKKK